MPCINELAWVDWINVGAQARLMLRAPSTVLYVRNGTTDERRKVGEEVTREEGIIFSSPEIVSQGSSGPALSNWQPIGCTWPLSS